MVWSDSERFLQNQSMKEFLYKWLYLNLHCIKAVSSDERPQKPTAWFRAEWRIEQLALLGALFNDAVIGEYYITSVADKYRDLVECYCQWKTNRHTERRICSSNNDERETVTNYRCPAVWKGAPGTTVLHVFFVFLISIIMCPSCN
jgi:hypothetical protein